MSSTHRTEHVPEQPREHEDVQVLLVAQINLPWMRRGLVDAGVLVHTPNLTASVHGGLRMIANVVMAAAKPLATGRQEAASPEERPTLLVTSERTDSSKADARQRRKPLPQEDNR
ncbi:hypothetical protein [Saccharopolyspora sp. NPDC002376]